VSSAALRAAPRQLAISNWQLAGDMESWSSPEPPPHAEAVPAVPQ
jgi:hypothetical protein